MKIDFHAHILPGVDHGSSDLQTSIKQIELAKSSGIDTIVSTSHFYAHKQRLDDFLKRREKAYKSLNSAIKGGKPKILLGAEVFLCQGIENMENIEKLCIGNTKCILLELPQARSTQRTIDTLEALKENFGLTPVLAHVDRYDPSDIEFLFKEGFYGQLNAQAVCSIFKRKRLIKWVEEGHIFALGSDIHGARTGYRYFDKACNLLNDKVELIMEKTKEILK